jgi:hypothetical protein
MKSSFFVAREVNTSFAASSSVACVCASEEMREGGGRRKEGRYRSVHM